LIRLPRFVGVSSFLVLSLGVLAARGGDGPPSQDPKLLPKFDQDKGRKDGVDAGLAVGLQSAFSHSSNYVGQADGATITIGLKFLTLVNYNHDKHEWRNSLNIGEGLTRTPVVSDVVKSRDAMAVESIYLYHVVDWAGPFVRVSWDTSLFRGADVRAGATTYLITRTDGTVETIRASRLTLTDPLRPSTFKESVGPFARPISSERANLEFRAGLGALEVLAANQRAVTDDATTPAVEVTELRSMNQLGVEEVVTFWGAASNKKVLYKVKGEAMTPFAHTALPAGDTRGAGALTNIELGATLSFKLVDWATLDYEFKALRQPELLDRFQVQNNLLLTFGLTAGTVPK
jgi:hypothetical protein